MTQHGANFSNFQANLRPLGVLSESKLPESLGSDVLTKLIQPAREARRPEGPAS